MTTGPWTPPASCCSFTSPQVSECGFGELERVLRPTSKSTLTGGKILSARGSHGTLWRRLFFRYPIGTSGFLTGPTAESRGPVTGSRLLPRLLIGKVQPPMAEHKYSTGPPCILGVWSTRRSYLGAVLARPKTCRRLYGVPEDPTASHSRLFVSTELH